MRQRERKQEYELPEEPKFVNLKKRPTVRYLFINLKISNFVYIIDYHDVLCNFYSL